MSDSLPLCPECNSDLAYEMGELLVCPMCGHEWAPGAEAGGVGAAETVVKDAVGNVLQDGDDVTIVKDLKVKGASGGIKVGTKVKGIRLLEDPVDGHDIDAKVPGFGAMKLKSSVVKKTN